MTDGIVFHTEWLTDLDRRVKALEAAVKPAPNTMQDQIDAEGVPAWMKRAMAPAPFFEGVVSVKSLMYGLELETPKLPGVRAGQRVHVTLRWPDAE